MSKPQTSLVQAAVAKMLQPGKAPKEVKLPLTPEQKAARMAEGKAKAAKDVQRKARKVLEAHFTAAQFQSLHDMADDAAEFQRTRNDWRECMVNHVLELHGESKPANGVYFAAVKYARAQYGAWTASCYRAAFVALYGGKVPTKGDKRATGKIKGYSPLKWHKGIASTLATLTERFNKCPVDDVDTDVLREFAAAYKALLAIDRKLAQRIAA